MGRERIKKEAFVRNAKEGARRQREWAEELREIGPLPKGLHKKKRNACRLNFRLFCETFLANRFPLKWGTLHLDLIAELQEKILNGGKKVFAFPRGSGKTSIVVAAAIWAAVYGHRKYLVLIGATAELAKGLVKDFRSEVESNDLLGEAFPDVCYPIAQLEGLMTRAAGQTLGGDRTRIGWNDRKVVLPTVKGAVASGVIVQSFGLTGSIRGLNHTVDGKKLRPDMLIVDDFQTRTSAQTVKQVEKRLTMLTGDLLGLSGPGVPLAAFCAGTVIAKADGMDQLLDRQKNPGWHGVRIKLLVTEPTDKEGWAEYARIRGEDLAGGGTGKMATEYYRTNRKAMDVGGSVSWEERKLPTELSALQHAMNLRFDLGQDAFASEYQNEPLALASALSATALTLNTLQSKVTGIPRGIVPREAVKLTAGVDLQDEVLVWLVCAWSTDGSGHVVDFGAWPEQPVEMWSTANVPNPLSSLYPGKGRAGRWFTGLTDLTNALIAKDWPRQETSEPGRVERIAIDSGWGKSIDTVYQACRRSPHAAILIPSQGRGIGPARQPMALWAKKPGDQTGPGFRIQTATGSVRGRHLTIDTNQWKSRVADMLRQPQGQPGNLTLPAGSHPLLFAHLTAEFPTLTGGPYGSVDVWAMNPTAAGQNHWWDCLVIASTLAATMGVSVSSLMVPAPPRPSETVSFAALAKQANNPAPLPSNPSGQVSFREMALKQANA
jgi:hypothetical protein